MLSKISSKLLPDIFQKLIYWGDLDKFCIKSKVSECETMNMYILLDIIFGDIFLLYTCNEHFGLFFEHQKHLA